MGASQGDFIKVGANLSLTPDVSSFSDPIRGILWRHGSSKVAELDLDFSPKVSYYGKFKGRTTLDTKTGHLVITDLSTSEVGVYSLELNSKPQKTTFDILVIEDVPKPQINETCDTPKTSCTLTCEGDTTGAEPVTYSWTGGEKVLNVTDKKLTVTGVDHQTEMYTCQIKNPVSEKSSPPHKNPFYPEDVPKPKINETCDTPKTSCTLTCEGDTTGAEPVTYSWKGGEKVLNATDKKLTVTGDDHQTEMYTCQIKNPVSEKSSPSHKNPFYPEDVPKPKIIETCDTPKTSCTLTCEGDTTGAEPVTYSWRGGEKVLSDTDKKLTVTGDDHKIKMYACQIKNPVSEKSSPPHKNPFYPEDVPKPQINETCDTPKTSCTLTCEGDTTGAEPVTYSWRGEEVLNVTDKKLTVTGDDHQTEMYTCQIKNPVSEKSSPPHKNPFYPEDVPEPKISETCDTPKTSCTLTCEGDTTGAEPVTYSWTGGEKVLNVTDKKLTVTGDDHQTEMYTCQIKNPVSEKSSPSHKNPFYPDQFSRHSIIAFVVIVSFIVGILIVHRLISGVWFYQKRAWCCLKDEMRISTEDQHDAGARLTTLDHQ